MLRNRAQGNKAAPLAPCKVRHLVAVRRVRFPRLARDLALVLVAVVFPGELLGDVQVRPRTHQGLHKGDRLEPDLLPMPAWHNLRPECSRRSAVPRELSVVAV